MPRFTLQSALQPRLLLESRNDGFSRPSDPGRKWFIYSYNLSVYVRLIVVSIVLEWTWLIACVFFDVIQSGVCRVGHAR